MVTVVIVAVVDDTVVVSVSVVSVLVVDVKVSSVVAAAASQPRHNTGHWEVIISPMKRFVHKSSVA